MFDLKRLENGKWAIGVVDGDAFVVIAEAETPASAREHFIELIDTFDEVTIGRAFAGEFVPRRKRTKLEVIK